MEAFQWELHENKNKVIIKTEYFHELVKKGKSFISSSTFYVDPPYYSSDSAYERVHYLGKWDGKKEELLYSTLDFIDENGGTFLLSNVLENNGQVNNILSEWFKKYHVIEVPSDYSNCNYQRKNQGKTIEVLVRNYDTI